MGERESEGAERLSRGALLTRAGGVAAVGAFSASEAIALGKPRRRSRMTPRRASRVIRRVMTGDFDPRDRRFRTWEVHRLLSNPSHEYRRGRETIELVRRQKAPPGVDLGELGVPPTSIPQNEISAAKFWWGYSVYFPHDPLINTVVTLIEDGQLAQLSALLTAAMNTVDLGWVVTALKAYVIGEVVLLVELDKKNDDGGAQLNATWASPLVYVPTEMSG